MLKAGGILPLMLAPGAATTATVLLQRSTNSPPFGAPPPSATSAVEIEYSPVESHPGPAEGLSVSKGSLCSLPSIEIPSEWGTTLLDLASGIGLPSPPPERDSRAECTASSFRHPFELEVSADEDTARSTIYVRLLGPFTAKCVSSLKHFTFGHTQYISIQAHVFQS